MATPSTSLYSSDWDFRTATTMPQPNGKIGTNTGNWTAATSIIISAVTRDNINATNAIQACSPGDQIKLELKNNPITTNSTWNVTAAPVFYPAPGNYFVIPVANLSALGVPAAGNPFTVTLDTEALPFPPPDNALYWILSDTDVAKFQHNADKLILQGFSPAGAIVISGTTTLTFTQAFWRSNSVAPFIERIRPTS